MMSMTLSSMRIAVATVFFSLAWSIWPSSRCWARLIEPRLHTAISVSLVFKVISVCRDRRATPVLRVRKVRKETPVLKVSRARKAIPALKVRKATKEIPVLKVRKVTLGRKVTLAHRDPKETRGRKGRKAKPDRKARKATKGAAS